MALHYSMRLTLIDANKEKEMGTDQTNVKINKGRQSAYKNVEYQGERIIKHLEKR